MIALNRTLALTMFIFSGLMLAAYFGLVMYFEFPDVLRLETTEMMKIFINHQSEIIFFYYLFVLSQVTFILLVLMLGHYYREQPSLWLTLATGLGILAGLCQAFGFLRWPFLVPYLAQIVQDPATSVASKEAALVVFQSIHNFAGIAIGENLFFLLEGLWAISFAIHLYQNQLLSKNLVLIPGLAGVMILIYSLEQFGGVFSVLAPLNIVAHGALVFWFIALAIVLMKINHKTSLASQPGWITTSLLWMAYLVIVLPGLVG